MKRLEIEIRDLLLGCPPIKIVADEGFEQFGEIMDANRDLIYGSVEVSEEGKMTSLMVDMDMITDNNDISLDEFEELSVDDIKELASEFVEEFGRGTLEIISFVEWGNDVYQIEFAAMDTKYNIPLPESGVMLEMTKQGFVLSATLNQNYYQLKYPEVTLTKQEAHDIFSSTIQVELGAEELEDQLKLMYYPKKTNIVVNVAGQLVELNELLGEEEVDFIDIPKIKPSISLSNLLGVTDDMSLLEEDGVMIYSSQENPQKYIKLHRADLNEVTVESSIPFEVTEELDIEILKDRALQFLELIIGNIDSKYLLEDQLVEEEEDEEEDDDLTEEEIALLKALSEEEDEEDDEEDDDEEEDDILEPFITFTFKRKLGNIMLDEFNAYIDMGIYTGAVKDTTIPLLNSQLIEDMVTDVDVTIDEANKLHNDSLEMKLARVPIQTDDFIVYELVYKASEKVKGQRIERIDAANGNVFYIDDVEYLEPYSEAEEEIL